MQSITVPPISKVDLDKFSKLISTIRATNELSQPQKLEIIRLLMKIIGAILTHPEIEKYRSVNISNSKVKSTLDPFTFKNEAFELLGFQINNNVAKLHHPDLRNLQFAFNFCQEAAIQLEGRAADGTQFCTISLNEKAGDAKLELLCSPAEIELLNEKHRKEALKRPESMPLLKSYIKLTKTRDKKEIERQLTELTRISSDSESDERLIAHAILSKYGKQETFKLKNVVSSKSKHSKKPSQYLTLKLKFPNDEEALVVLHVSCTGDQLHQLIINKFLTHETRATAKNFKVIYGLPPRHITGSKNLLDLVSIIDSMQGIVDNDSLRVSFVANSKLETFLVDTVEFKE